MQPNQILIQSHHQTAPYKHVFAIDLVLNLIYAFTKPYAFDCCLNISLRTIHHSMPVWKQQYLSYGIDNKRTEFDAYLIKTMERIFDVSVEIGYTAYFKCIECIDSSLVKIRRKNDEHNHNHNRTVECLCLLHRKYCNPSNEKHGKYIRWARAGAADGINFRVVMYVWRWTLWFVVI